MALALRRASRFTPEIRLAQAISQFEASLSDRAKADFKTLKSQTQNSTPGVQDVMMVTAEINKRGLKAVIGPRFTNMLMAVQQFAAIGDVIIGGSQNLPACGVWCVVRTSLELLIGFSSLLERLSSLFMEIGHSSPRYDDLALLYSCSDRIKRGLSEYFIIVVKICEQFVDYSEKSKHEFIQLTNSAFDTRLRQSEVDLKQYAAYIKEEVDSLNTKTLLYESPESSRLRALIDRKVRERDSQKLKRRLDYLSACTDYDHETPWKQARKRGNTMWFATEKAYMEFKSCEHSSILVLTGKLRSGKTVLAANVVDDLILSGNGTVCYFFIGHDISDSCHSSIIIRSLCRQLLTRHINDDAVDMICAQDHPILDDDAILDLLRSLIKLDKRVFFVLDGLDDCDYNETQKTVSTLRNLIQCTTDNVLLVFASLRSQTDDFHSKYRGLDPQQLLSITEENPDIRSYIDSKLANTSASYSASRPSGGTRKTHATSAGYQGVMTDPTLYSCDESDCEDAQPDECERVQAMPTEHQQNQGLYSTKTEYSVSNGTRNERYITDLATDLFEAVKPCHADLNALGRLSELLPDLLRAFAVKISHQALSQTDLDVAYFIQKHREEIQSSFQDESLSLQGSTKADEVRNGEFSIERFLEDHTTEFARLPENEQPENELPEYPEGSRPDFEDTRSELDPGKYRDYILKSPAYDWLIGTLQRESALKRATPVDVMSRIRADILAALPAARSVSRSAPSQRYKATFELLWDPLAFVNDQAYTKAAEVALRRAITITGSADDAQAATTRDYLVQTWPNGGKIMQLIEDVTRCGRKSPVSCVLSDKTELEVWMDDGKFVALATGPGDSIVEVGQQLAWVGAALQSSTSTTGIAPCTPFVSSATLKPTDTLSSESKQFPEILCVIDFDIQLPATDNAERPGHCWHEMFRNPVMVVGYPILSKPASNSGLGLELPLNMMSILAGSDRVHEFEDKVLIKGFSTMISATKRLGNLIVWHYFYNADGGKISHLDLMLDHEFNGSLSLSELESARHVVGWCSECKLYAGMLNASKDLKRAKGLPRPSSGCRLDRISLSGGKIISAGASIAIGLKDPPAHLTIKGYIPKLKSIDKKYVVLWDEADKRGWLVNGTSALLHLVRASLHHSSQDKFSSAFLWKQGDMAESDSAVDVLIDSANRILKLYADKPTVSDEDEVKREGGNDSEKESTANKRKWDYYTFQDLVEQHYHYLDQIIDYQVRAEARNGADLKANFRTRLEGWDFVELATDSSIQIFPRVATLQALGWGWVDFIRSIGAVTLFGSHFGELMKPEVFKGMCPKWKTLPNDRYYLAVSGADLEKISLDSGRLVWHSPTEPIAPCHCQGRSLLRPHFGGHHDPVQVFYPKRSRLILPTKRCETIHTDGAYVFGHNVTWPYNWKAGKKEDEDDLEERNSGDSSDSGFREDLARASVDQSSQSSVSGTDATTLSPVQSGLLTTRLSERPLTPSTGPSYLHSEGSLPHRLASKQSQPSDASFESETGHIDDAHRQARRLKRQNLK